MNFCDCVSWVNLEATGRPESLTMCSPLQLPGMHHCCPLEGYQWLLVAQSEGCWGLSPLDVSSPSPLPWPLLEKHFPGFIWPQFWLPGIHMTPIFLWRFSNWLVSPKVGPLGSCLQRVGDGWQLWAHAPHSTYPGLSVAPFFSCLCRMTGVGLCGFEWPLSDLTPLSSTSSLLHPATW